MAGREAGQTGGGRLLPLQLTPYILGLPYRIGAFERLLGDLVTSADTWFAGVSEIAAVAGV